MRRSYGELTLCILLSILWTISPAETEERYLSRRKRYVVFPEGSSFSIALCMTVHTLTPDNIFTEGLNWGISYDLPNESKPAIEPFLQLRKDHHSIDVKHRYSPVKIDQRINNNNPFKYNDWNMDTSYYNGLDGGKKMMVKKKKNNYYYRRSDYDYFKRRHRRELYNKLEVIMNAMGFDGRSCILRALCEASQRLMPRGNTLVEEMMRIAFSLPLKRALLSHEPNEHHIYTEAHRNGHNSVSCSNMYTGCSFSLIDMALGRYSRRSDFGMEANSQDMIPEAIGNLPGNILARYSMK
ncbi:hypothetical protein PV326_012342 [Microctonus aethiopoides]|nr:hypothetical protein PV326_012342 [Microctonus aethiopoides]